VEFREEVAREAGADEALRGVVDTGEHHVADEGEDDGVGVKRTETPEGEPGEIEVEAPVVELRGDEHADEHADGAPDDGGEHEVPDNLVVELDGDFAVLHGSRRKGVRAQARLSDGW
jgi:23S rRNA (cytosine1962-C5)-methyltransferase